MPQTNKVVTQVNQLLEEASNVTRDNPQKCIELSEKALEMAKLNHYDLGIGNAYANIGSGCYHLSDYQKAIDYYLLAEPIIRKEQFYRGLRGIYNNLGIIYCRRNELAKALEYYYKNLELEDNYQDPKSNCLILNNIGRVYSLLDDYKKALQYYKEVLDICQEHGFSHERLITLNNIGYSYFKLKELEQAEHYLLMAVDFGRDNNNKSGLMTVYSSLAELKTETGEYEQALDLLFQALHFAEELGDQYKTAKFCLYMANTYEKIDHLEKQKNYLEKCVAIAEPNKYRSIALSAYEALAQFHEKQSAFQRSIGCYKKVQQIKDFLNDEKRTRTVHEIITKLEVERTEKENERLRLKTLELEKQNQLIMVRNTFDRLLNNENYENKYQIINDSQKMNNVLLLMDQVAKVDNTDVLITGESGTGKELVARGIHLLSSRKQNMFFDINCTAIPDTLFESEFFGHTENAFTGADSLKKGGFEIADRGTIFLDEIGDMPLELQTKLLRVLEERKIRRVGSSEDIHLDIRVIASTNQDILQRVKKNRFRADLYYRLNKFNIHIPPLRERPEDIIALINYYTEKFCKLMRKPLKPFAPKTIEKLQTYHFPGNVRELKNLVEKAVIMSHRNDNYLSISEFNQENDSSINGNVSADISELTFDKLTELERLMIVEVMKKTANNKSQAAKLLKINRRSLQRKIDKHGLNFPANNNNVK